MSKVLYKSIVLIFVQKLGYGTITGVKLQSVDWSMDRKWIMIHWDVKKQTFHLWLQVLKHQNMLLFLFLVYRWLDIICFWTESCETVSWILVEELTVSLVSVSDVRICCSSLYYIILSIKNNSFGLLLQEKANASWEFMLIFSSFIVWIIDNENNASLQPLYMF